MTETSPYINAEIGEEYKTKLEQIAEKQKRTMKSQLQIMIDYFHQEEPKQ